jgi:hypothetical protein
MNFFLLAFVIQIFGLYAMILLSDYVLGILHNHGNSHRVKKQPLRIKR